MKIVEVLIMRIRRWGRVLFVGVGLIFLGWCMIAWILSYRNVRMEEQLEEEIEQIEKVLNKESFDYKKLSPMLNKYISKKDYQKVEIAYKEYVIDYFKIEDEINNLKNTEVLKEEDFSHINQELDNMKDTKTIYKYLEVSKNKRYYQLYLKSLIGRFYRTKHILKVIDDYQKLYDNFKKQQ